MRLPQPLLRHKKNVHKNTFGHVLILAGSAPMMGAGCLASLAAMRTGAGLVTLGVPRSLNLTAQRKVSQVVMTLPLPETSEKTFSFKAFKTIEHFHTKSQAIALGPGMGTHPDTQKLIRKIIAASDVPLVIDADAIHSLAGNLNILKKTSTPKILTPHPGEMARLLNIPKSEIEKHRNPIVRDFAFQYHCVLLLKGHRTIIASAEKKIWINTTGNPGMATAGSGDVLTGMIAALLAQGLSAFEAAKWGAYLHGRAGDLAAEKKGKAGLIASDIIDDIPCAIKSLF